MPGVTRNLNTKLDALAKTNKEKKGTWKIGLIAGHAAGLPPGIKEGPYLGMIVKKWKK